VSHFTLHERHASFEALLRAYGVPGELKIDLGCGYSKPDGYIGLDNLSVVSTQEVRPDNAPDILMDLNDQPLPFANDSVAVVRASHFLEHAPQIEHIIRESHRVLKPGGEFTFRVPYANSADGMYPGHVHFLTEKWFHCNRTFNATFEIREEVFLPSPEWLAFRPWTRLIPFRFARTFLFNSCCEMRMTCRPRK